MTYAQGEWIVHPIHGTGQIMAIEEKSISSEEVTYYRTQMENSLIWIPVTDEELIRPVSPPENFEKVLEVLQRHPREMSSAFKKRSKRIKESREMATPVSWSRTIRDLWGRKRDKGRLSQVEERALKRMMNQLTSEWAASMNLEKEKLNRRIIRLLNRGKTVQFSNQ